MTYLTTVVVSETFRKKILEKLEHKKRVSRV